MATKLRWWQFRLRTLLIVSLLICVGGGYFIIKLKEAHQQRDAVAALEKMDRVCSVFYDYEYPDGDFSDYPETDHQRPKQGWLDERLGFDFFHSVKHLKLHLKKDNSEAVLKTINLLPNLDKIVIHIELEDIEVAEMVGKSEVIQRARAVGLNILSWNSSYNSFKNAGILMDPKTEYTIVAPEVNIANYHDEPVDRGPVDTGIVESASKYEYTLPSRIDELNVTALAKDDEVMPGYAVMLGPIYPDPTYVEDPKLELTAQLQQNEALLGFLSPLKNTNFLNLTDLPLSDSATVQLKNFPRLEVLYISHQDHPSCIGQPYLTSTALENIGTLTNLQELHMFNTKITDEAVKHLKDLSHLIKLDLSYTAIGDDALVTITNFKKLKYLDLESTRVTDTGLAQLKDLKNLEELYLSGISLDFDPKAFRQLPFAAKQQYLSYIQQLAAAQHGLSEKDRKRFLQAVKENRALTLRAPTFTDEGLKYLSELTNLRILCLNESEINGSGLVHLKRLQKLETLDLNLTTINDEGMKHLVHLKNLTTLGLEKTEVTDRGLKALSGLSNLKYLSLKDIKIADAGLAGLNNLQKLDSLDLSGTEITDAGLASLSKLQNLEHLSLSNTKITDEGLVHLHGLENLLEPSIDGSKCTAVGVKKLTMSLPKHKIGGKRYWLLQAP